MKFVVTKKEELNEKEYSRLIELSEIWVNENISFGLVKNTKEDINFPCFIATINDEIVGYAFGHYNVVEKKSCSLIEVGSTCFFVDEIYVHPNYRSQGIGRALFLALENEVKGKATFITLSTSTKDYQKIFKFYDEQNGMTFHDAYFVKKL